MIPSTFQCYLTQKTPDGHVTSGVQSCPSETLPSGDVLIRVAYSSLNYKDALSATGHPGVTKNYPHVPGIDAVGEVVTSSSDRFRPGDQVLVTGFDLGMNTWGGWSELIRVPAGWVLPLPSGLSPWESMLLGTAGFTAGLCLDAILRREINPARGEVLVTGASGGVGTIAVALLAHAGFQVTAVTGKPAAHRLLSELGATRIISRQEVDDTCGRTLLKPRWAAAVDTVGGNTLGTILRSIAYGGCVTACGLVGGSDLPATVYPFILRAVELAGIDSAEYPLAKRPAIWENLASRWRPPGLSAIGKTVTLDDLGLLVPAILAGESSGRMIIKV